VAAVTLRHRQHALLRRRIPVRPAAVLAAVAFALCGTGCLSHEYRVSQAELVRLAQLPPEARGARIRVVQELGQRRGDAIEAVEEPQSQIAADGWDGDVDLSLDVNLEGGGRHGGGHARGPGLHPAGARPVTALHGRPVGAPGAHSGGVRPSSGGGGGGLSNLMPSGGGGGGKGEELVVIAVIVVAIAALAAVGLAVTEGMRYDGEVAAAPGQRLYIGSGDAERAVALADLTPADAAAASGAILRDDEGWGLHHAGRAPLDRRGVAFKVDLGGFSALLDHYSVGGFASHIQLGVFPWQRLGLLASWDIAAGSDARGSVFARHGLALEAQAFPVQWGPLSLGLFGHGGPSLATDARGELVGVPAFGGGALVELALTTRLALTFRADWTATRADGDTWAPSRSFSGGLAIY
jgi:hypothetical protein